MERDGWGFGRGGCHVASTLAFVRMHDVEEVVLLGEKHPERRRCVGTVRETTRHVQS